MEMLLGLRSGLRTSRTENVYSKKHSGMRLVSSFLTTLFNSSGVYSTSWIIFSWFDSIFSSAIVSALCTLSCGEDGMLYNCIQRRTLSAEERKIKLYMERTAWRLMYLTVNVYEKERSVPMGEALVSSQKLGSRRHLSGVYIAL